jgi:short-subunit dehydrogenase
MRIAVVTGASAGIGREFVRAIDREGAFEEIWVIARRAERLEELKQDCATPLRPVVLDLTAEESVTRYRELLEKEQPEIGLLVNAAGCGVFGPFAEKELDKLLASARLNSLTLTAMCHVSLPYMKKDDAIVNMGSNSAWQPVPWQAVYGASKSYVLSLSRALWRELKPRGIHVMCVCPGWVKTEFQATARHDDYIRYVDRWYGPEEVAAQAMRDLKKKKLVSILGHPVRRQVRLVKFLPVKLVMKIWCRQQGIE